MIGGDEGLGDPRTDSGLRKQLERRLKGMRAQRSAWEPIWMEIARFCAPKTGRLLAAFAGNGTNYANDPQVGLRDNINSKLLDSRAVWASEVLANGMHSGLTSPARPWFKLTVPDPEMRKFQAVKEWLDEVERRLYEFFAKTNFYTAIKGGYRSLGNYGVSAGFMESHWELGGVTHPLAIGEYWLGLSAGLVADSLYRRVPMTVIQHYQRFGKDKVPRRVAEDYDRGNYDALHTVWHGVEPNDLREIGRRDAKGKKFRSVYWSQVCDDNEKNDDGKAILQVQGYNSKPFWAPRWDVEGNDTYSTTSPGLNALADVRQLQLGVLRKQQAMDYVIKPPLRGPATLNNIHVALQPGRVTAMAGVDKDSFGAIWEVDARIVGLIAQDNTETREAVDRGYYADLFNAITNMRGVQPRNVEEIASRNEEKLTQLGPVVERVNQEELTIAIDRAFDILASANMLPPPPQEMSGMALQVEFISVLAQAQRLIGLGSIERTFGFVTSIADHYPDVLASLDGAAAVDEYADIVSLPAAILRAPEARKKLLDAQAAQQQQAQQAEMAATMAPAAKQGVEAANLLYNTPGVGSQPSLADRLLGTS